MIEVEERPFQQTIINLKNDLQLVIKLQNKMKPNYHTKPLTLISALFLCSEQIKPNQTY